MRRVGAVAEAVRQRFQDEILFDVRDRAADQCARCRLTCFNRGAKAISALLALVLIADWGLNWDWQRLSIASLIVTGLWIFTAQLAKRGYLRAFRSSIERRVVAPAEVRVNVGDLQTVEGTGLLARCFQHEMDHLDGTLFVDRLRGLQKDLIVRKIKKLAKAGKW